MYEVELIYNLSGACLCKKMASLVDYLYHTNKYVIIMFRISDIILFHFETRRQKSGKIALIHISGKKKRNQWGFSVDAQVCPDLKGRNKMASQLSKGIQTIIAQLNENGDLIP